MKLRMLDLKEGQYLGDVLDELPCGIIDKTYTANGGTTVELKAQRDSIIVESLKSVAFCKKKKFPNIIVVNGDIQTERIKNKIVKQRKKQEFVKIITTPESIWKVKEALDIVGEDMNGYFFLIDEIHMHQTDSDYRSEMGRATEEYHNQHNHNQHRENRAIMTATLYPFSDDRFEDEARTKVVPNQPPLPITLFTTNNFSEASKKIWDGEQFVFINSVIGAKEIEKSLGFDCNIYCSDHKKSQETAAKSFRKFDDELSDVNIYTSAYFTGYDIEASGDIIIVVNGYHPHTMLSLLTLYQITGRLREGLGKIKLIVVLNRKNQNKMTKKELREAVLKAAEKQESWWNEGLESGLLHEANKNDFIKYVLEKAKPFNARLTRQKNNSDEIEID